MKKTLIVYLAVSLVVIAFGSCEKSKNPSVQERVTGKWKLVSWANDFNRNGIVDTGEQGTQSSAYSSFLVLASNQKGYQLLNSDTQDVFDWTIEADTTILVELRGNGYYRDIISLTANNMTLRDTINYAARWMDYTRQ